MPSTLASIATALPARLQSAETEEPAWFTEVLCCAHCGSAPLLWGANGRTCPRCQACFPVRNGIVYLIRPEWSHLFADLPQAWRQLAEARGNYPLSLEQLLRLPADPLARQLSDWLRTALRQRGCCRILELGAGNGWAARLLAEDGHQVIASDVLDDPHIGLGGAARQRTHSGPWFGCVVTGAETLPFRAESFDGVFCHDVLGQVVDLERTLREIARVLRPGGLFVALHELFRGLFTTQAQRVHGHPSTYFDLPDNSRRVPLALSLAADAGLSATVLPLAAAVTLSPSWTSPLADANAQPPVWLDSLAAGYQLDADQLRQRLDRDCSSGLLAHWMLVGNSECMLLAGKGEAPWKSLPEARLREPRSCRHWDPLLLACAAAGFVPLHGVYPGEGTGTERYWWLQPDVALLVPLTEAIDLTLACPPPDFLPRPVRVEVAWEEEEIPALVLMIAPGKTVRVRVPGPESAPAFGSLLLRLRISAGFRPSNRQEGHQDTRELAMQLRGVHLSRAAKPMSCDTSTP